MRSNQIRAFTLVEMLTVIAIIGLLAGLILPAMRRAKEKAKMTECANNLMQFGHAVGLFRAEHDDEFPDWLSNLYPSYIGSKKMYLCPADYCTQGTHKDYSSHVGADGGKPWWEPDDQEFRETDDTRFNTQYNKQLHPRNSEVSRDSGDTVDYCSYLYQFCEGYRGGHTWKYFMLEEMAKGVRQGARRVRVGGRIPLIRCFWHQKRKPGTTKYAARQKNVINVAVGHKNVYYSDASEEGWWK